MRNPQEEQVGQRNKQQPQAKRCVRGSQEAMEGQRQKHIFQYTCLLSSGLLRLSKTRQKVMIDYKRSDESVQNCILGSYDRLQEKWWVSIELHSGWVSGAKELGELAEPGLNRSSFNAMCPCEFLSFSQWTMVIKQKQKYVIRRNWEKGI